MAMGSEVVEQRRDDHENARRDLPVRATTNGLQMCGLSTTEAANLAAHLSGLRIVKTGWTAKEIEHLLFLRAIVEAHRLER